MKINLKILISSALCAAFLGSAAIGAAQGLNQLHDRVKMNHLRQGDHRAQLRELRAIQNRRNIERSRDRLAMLRDRRRAEERALARNRQRINWARNRRLSEERAMRLRRMRENRRDIRHDIRRDVRHDNWNGRRDNWNASGRRDNPGRALGHFKDDRGRRDDRGGDRGKGPNRDDKGHKHDGG